MKDHESPRSSDDAERLKAFVGAMPQMDRYITELWFGLGDGYSYGLREIAAILKSDAFEIDERIREIEHQLEQAGLRVNTRRSAQY